MKTLALSSPRPNFFQTPEFLKNLGKESFASAATVRSGILIVSDFDHTLTRNDCGAQVANLAGIAEPEFFELARQVGVKNPRTEKGAEFAALMIEEPRLNRAGKKAMLGAINAVSLKDHVGEMYRALDAGVLGREVNFYVVSAGPQATVRGALAKVGVPSGHVIGTRFEYDVAGRPTSVKHASAGRGKVELIEDLQKLHQVVGTNVIYFGDGSSDIEAMKHVQAAGGFNIAVEDNAALRPYRSMLLESNDVLDWVKPITERVSSLSPSGPESDEIKDFVRQAQVMPKATERLAA